MIGWLRRLDATNVVPQGKKAMDPMAPDKTPKFYIAGSATPMYGHFFYPFMDKVMSVALKTHLSLDKVFSVSTKRALDGLLKARFVL